ncbi:MAG: aspartate aminotransferase family protein [Bryobacterales bacterium]|nr:aspartate aminotransferase family protein [Bryobacterales bacterium]
MPEIEPFGAEFFGSGGYGRWLALAEQVLAEAPRAQAYSGATPESLAELLDGEICPERGIGMAALRQRLASITANSIQPWHPRTAAHLHTPVLLPALAAEAVLAALNQSMDSFDQAPAASVLEQKVLHWLCRLAGLPQAAGGTFTAGGTQSNYMGLLLARDHFLKREMGWDAREMGLPPDAGRMRFLCSEVAHFSVEKSAIQLGLGLRAVVKVPCDDGFRMRTEALRATIAALRAEGLWPAVVVATAGTTDFGSIDPLAEIAGIAKDEGLWLHVDAAYGGALLLTQKHAGRLAGVERADSVTMDFHKAFFQPISCSAFLLADERRFETIRVYADYLNTESREAEGIPDLVTRSVLTTRRFDALKLWVSLQVLGRARFGAMVEKLVMLAESAADWIDAHPALELLARPEFGAVVFRFRAGMNEEIPRVLFEQGRAVIGHTVVRGAPCMKLTLCNPVTEPADLHELLCAIVQCGEALTAAASVAD